jgi:hypothetical protein
MICKIFSEWNIFQVKIVQLLLSIFVMFISNTLVIPINFDVKKIKVSFGRDISHSYKLKKKFAFCINI